MASTNNYEEEKAQMEEHLQFVAREIGRDWKKLGRKLKIGHTVIECIEVEYTTEEERAYQVLVKWWQDKGYFGATKDILIKALKDIGKTSVAQGIGYCDPSSEDRRENYGQKKPLQQTSSIKSEEPNKSSVTHSSSSPFPTPNGFKFERFDKELDKMLNYCQESLPSCHPPELGHILKFLEYIQALNEMMIDTTDSRTRNEDDEPEIAEMKEAHTVRHVQTEQTIQLTKMLLKSRPVSEIFPRCTSIIDPPPRSDTDSEVTLRKCKNAISLRKYKNMLREYKKCDISSPISTTKHKNGSSSTGSSSFLSPLPEPICTDLPNAKKTEEPQLTPRCATCDSCLNSELETDEKQETSLDENCHQKSKSGQTPHKIITEQ